MIGRSGKLIAKNDPFIIELLNDPNYYVDVNSIMTRITKTGKVSVTDSWRVAGTIKKNYVSIRYKYKSLQLHRIIWAHQHEGKLSEDLVVYHKDGDTFNNHISNLAHSTQSDCNLNRFKRKKPVMGNTVLTWNGVRMIRQMKKEGRTHIELAELFAISKGHVSEIVNNKIWIETKEYHETSI